MSHVLATSAKQNLSLYNEIITLLFPSEIILRTTSNNQVRVTAPRGLFQKEGGDFPMLVRDTPTPHHPAK